MLAEYGLKVLGAILIFLIGRYVAGVLSRILSRILTKAKVDPTLVPFIENLSYTAMLVFVVVAALDRVGVQTASFIAVLGAAGLAVGLALQGSLANFASGVLLLVFKPFRVGDFVEIGGVKGTVQAIQIFNTVINSPDNIRIVVPNGQVTGGTISNYTVNGTRRVDLVVSVSYGDDLQKARRVIDGVLSERSANPGRSGPRRGGPRDGLQQHQFCRSTVGQDGRLLEGLLGSHREVEGGDRRQRPDDPVPAAGRPHQDRRADLRPQERVTVLTAPVLLHRRLLCPSVNGDGAGLEVLDAGLEVADPGIDLLASSGRLLDATEFRIEAQGQDLGVGAHLQDASHLPGVRRFPRLGLLRRGRSQRQQNRRKEHDPQCRSPQRFHSRSP
jgi:small conductance mechanosensitive channel